ncbi:MAG: RagB/SusD family nutrient uptake outer membrane protein [Prevotella sp.]|nr:RagB/SusD family nutrient uptake outer membrane protein [Prevotella sp.]
MKLRYMKKIALVTFAAILGLCSVSCTKDLDQSVQDEQTNTELDMTSYLAKVYSSLVLTGQTGGAGNPDMSQFDEGNSSFYRRIFEANELCSDEIIWTWQGDAGIPELTNISWNSSHGYTELTYYRIMYNVTLCNYYLDTTAGTTDTAVLNNRAEVRFIRALMYYYFMDLYGKAPFKVVYNDELPTEASRQQVFDFVVGELKAISEGSDGEQLKDFCGDDTNYGRADKVAAKMLLARIYLNAEVYTGTAQWQSAIDYASQVISSNYKLCTTALNGYTAYEQLFMGDNGENANARQEIIFPIRCDGATSRSYGGSVYTIASCTGSGTPDQSLASSQWTCNRARQALIDKFVADGVSYEKKAVPVADFRAMAGDDRAMFFVNGDRTYSTEEKTTFTAGFGVLKWNNTYAQGGTPSDAVFSDTDIPFLRVAEAYLTRAEANFRLGNAAEASTDINVLRDRANAAHVGTGITEKDIIDEWCREFYMEGRRRSDLIRFGLFTSNTYIWDWKGGAYLGTGVSNIYNLYPIPANELSANSNMTQNEGY